MSRTTCQVGPCRKRAKLSFCREFPDVFEVAGLGVLTPRNLDAILDRHAASLTSTADGHALDEARSLGAGVLDGVVVQPLRAGVMPGAGQAAELELGLLDPRLARLSPRLEQLGVDRRRVHHKR